MSKFQLIALLSPFIVMADILLGRFTYMFLSSDNVIFGLVLLAVFVLGNTVSGLYVIRKIRNMSKRFEKCGS